VDIDRTGLPARRAPPTATRSPAALKASSLADLCSQEGLPGVLCLARSMQASHGGQVQHDQLDAHTTAVLRRGGLRPQASVDPTARRTPRELAGATGRAHAALLPHVQHTPSPSNLAASGTKLADHAHHDSGAARCPTLAVQKRSAVALARIDDDPRRRELACPLRTAATPPPVHTRYLLRTVLGFGQLLHRVLL
jgi:hypothetical protein